MIHCLHYPAPSGQAEVLLIMLPGAGIEADEFAEQGMVAAVHALGLAVDVIVARPDIGALPRRRCDGGAAPRRGGTGTGARLHAHLAARHFARRHGRAALCQRASGRMWKAWSCSRPFSAPGAPLPNWRAPAGCMHGPPTGSAATHTGTTPVDLAAGASGRARADAPALYLGYAARDRFAPAHKMLAASLPPARVAVAARRA